MRIHLVSSCQNLGQPRLVEILRGAGFEVYDFRNPCPGEHQFSWSDIDADWLSWTQVEFRDALGDPLVMEEFQRGMVDLQESDVCLLLLPAGRWAHLELGWCVGHGKPTCVLLADGEPELMYLIADRVCVDEEELFDWLAEVASREEP